MAQKKNQNKQSGQLARQSQKSNNQQIQKAPVAIARQMKVSQPKVVTTPKCSKISHRELVSTISGNTTYAVTSFALNPGISATFPWLSSVANSYEQYRFLRLRFIYVPRCATSYAGSVLLSPEYDALDSAPTSEASQAMMLGTEENVPWVEQMIDLSVPDMFSLGSRKFTRSTSVSNSDLKTYDAGQLFVGRASCADTNAIGKLWVEYDVELYVPQNPSVGLVSAIGSASIYNLASDQTITTATPTVILFDTESYDSIGTSVSSGVITLPAGNYLIRAVLCMTVNSTTSAVDISLIQDTSTTIVSASLGSLASGQESSFPLVGSVTSTGSNTVKLSVTYTSGGTIKAEAGITSLEILRVI